MKLAPGPAFPELLKRSLRFETRSFDLDRSLRELHGPVVRIRWPAEKHLLYDPKDFEYVLKTNANNYRRGSQLRPILGKSIATSEGEDWKRQKRIIGREFVTGEFAKHAHVVEGLVDELVGRWQERSSVDLTSEFMDFTFKVAARTLFGSEVKSSDIDTVRSSIKVLSDFAIRQVHSPLPLPKALITPGKVHAFLAAKKVHGIIDRIVQDFKVRPQKSDIILARLMKGRDEDLLSDLELRSEAFTLLLAGHETTSNALTWCLYLLARHPEYQARAFEDPGFIDLILKEALRLYPPFPLLSRTANGADEIRGYHIPKDSRVYCMTFVSQRHPDFWEQPEKFLPERFARETSPMSFLPFGGGTRKCVGADFAWEEMRLLLRRVLREFTFSLTEEREVRPVALVTLVPEREITLRLNRRT